MNALVGQGHIKPPIHTSVGIFLERKFLKRKREQKNTHLLKYPAFSYYCMFIESWVLLYVKFKQQFSLLSQHMQSCPNSNQWDDIFNLDSWSQRAHPRAYWNFKIISEIRICTLPRSQVRQMPIKFEKLCASPTMYIPVTLKKCTCQVLRPDLMEATLEGEI